MQTIRSVDQNKASSQSRYRGVAPIPTLSLVLLLAACFLSSCGKSGGSAPATSTGPAVDITKLRQAFPSPSPEIQDVVQKIYFAARYQQWDNALGGLEKLAADPSLTETQKQVVKELTDNAKKLWDAGAPKPAQ